jgi:hypothetical protein
MSTIQRVNFEPVSDILATQRRDFPLADKTLADPLASNPLVDGEWMIVAAGKAARATAVAAAGVAATQRSYAVFSTRGSTVTQAMSEKKVPLMYMGEYEADTRIFDAALVVGSGAAVTVEEQGLKVASISLGGVIKTGLVGHGGAADTAPVVARVSKLPANNGGKLRIKVVRG